jgi:nitrogen fixation protein FixH
MSNAIMNDRKISQDNPNAWKNPWVIGWVSLVAVVIIVNVTMISIAFITSPGLVEENYYEKGQDYEQNINKIKAERNALAWSYTTDFPGNPVINKKSHYSFNLVDKYGVALIDADVSFTAYRPSDADADFKIKMIETVSGRYEANITYPLKGIWQFTITINSDTDTFSFTRRTSVLNQ